MYFMSFQKKLFWSVSGIFLLFVFLFVAYQYRREREHKIDTMHISMQVYNLELAHSLGDSICSPTAFSTYIRKHDINGLRVTIMDLDGKVLLDNRHNDVAKLPNHGNRVEFLHALADGEGYDIKRTSESTKETYFYSATHVGNYIIRSAIPYSATLTASLKPDYSFLWYSLFITFLLGIVLYRSIMRISRHIGHLREFAIKANSGDKLDHELERKLPDDELGDISHTIITLFWKLRHSEDDKQRLKHQLTQNAAHELKTPVASINGYLESIVNSPDMPENTRNHFLQRCYAQSQRMCHLLQDMSTLAQMDEAPQFERTENQAALPAVNICDLVDTIIDESAQELQDKGIEAKLCIPETVELHCDRGSLYSIFRNLVDNALAYAIGATSLKITCEVAEDTSLKPGERCYRFAVSDNGCGVDPKHLPHIFERFYRIDKGRSRKMGGTGLGLAIVKNTVAIYGGTVIASGTYGGGLTVSFTLRG